MRYPLISLLPLLAACSQNNAELAIAKQLRSVAAEWAFVNQEAVRQNLPKPYVSGMRKAAQAQIKEAAQSIDDPASELGRLAATLQRLPPDAPSELLWRQAAALKAIEDRLESA